MQVHVSTKHRAIGVPWQADVSNMFPDAKPIMMNGSPHLVLPHGLTETFVLRRLGFEVPSPIETHYDWAGGTPFDVQKKTCSLLTLNQRAYVLNGMGTGKTKTALWSWDYLNQLSHAKKMLVVGPLSTLHFTWAREVFNTLQRRKCAVLHGTKQKRLDRLRDPDTDIFIVNHDGVKVIQPEIEEMIAAGELDTLCIDELALYRNGGAQRTKSMRKLAAKFKWVWGMTGAPTPHSPSDAWGQCTIVTPHTVPKYFSHFRGMVEQQVNQFRWVPKADATEQVFKVMQPAVRFSLDDILELPETIERTLDIDLGPQQAKVYKELADACYSAVQKEEITAANAGAVLMKLLQVSLGWVYAKDGKVVHLDNGNRIQAMIDAINSCDRKILVFVPFKHALEGICAAMAKEGIEHAAVSGDTPAGERSKIFNLFQNTSKYKVLAAHPKCLAHGITLTAADTVLWFAPVADLETYDQANHRIIRVGQHHKQLILHLQSTPVERRMYQMLRGRQQVQNHLLDLFADASASVTF